MWPIVTILTLYVATAGNLGLEQAGRANRSVLDAVVFYADPPSEVTQFPRDLREDLQRYFQRLGAYRPRPRPPQLGPEMTMVYAARERYERKLVGASTRSGVEQLAQEYVDTLRPCYESEGFHDCPEREAIFAERYLIDHPDTAFAGFLRVLAAHRWLCAAEAYEYAAATWQRRARPARVSKGAGHSGQSRVAVDEGRRRRAAVERPLPLVRPAAFALCATADTSGRVRRTSTPTPTE